MRFLYIVAGILSLILGVVGIFLPILPTVPFLLITMLCFAKGSPRLEAWFKSTSIYTKYLESYATQRALSKKTKIRILAMSTIMLAVGFIFTPVWWGKLLIILILGIKYYIFIFKIKTLEDLKPMEKCHE